MSDMLPFLLTALEATEANCRRCPHLCHPPTAQTAAILLSHAHSHTQACRGLPSAVILYVSSQLAATFPPQLPVHLTFPVQA